MTKLWIMFCGKTPFFNLGRGHHRIHAFFAKGLPKEFDDFHLVGSGQVKLIIEKNLSSFLIKIEKRSPETVNFMGL